MLPVTQFFDPLSQAAVVWADLDNGGKEDLLVSGIDVSSIPYLNCQAVVFRLLTITMTG